MNGNIWNLCMGNWIWTLENLLTNEKKINKKSNLSFSVQINTFV